MSDIRNYFEEIVKQTLERFDNGELSEGDLRMLARPMEWLMQDTEKAIVGFQYASKAMDWDHSHQTTFSIKIEDVELDEEVINWLQIHGFQYLGELTRYKKWKKTLNSSWRAQKTVSLMKRVNIWQFTGQETPWVPPYHDNKKLIKELSSTEVFKAPHFQRKNGTVREFILDLAESQLRSLRYSRLIRVGSLLRPGIYVEYWLDENGNFNPNKTLK